MDKKLKQLLDTNHIIKHDKCSDDVFISSIVITAKHDKSKKLALDSQLLDDAINKNKYQMQLIDNLMDAVAKYISDNKQIPWEFFSRKIDLKYAYSQIHSTRLFKNIVTLISSGENLQAHTDS